VKTNQGLVKWAKKGLQDKLGYIYGDFFSRVTTEKSIQEKAKQYPGQYSRSYIRRSRKWIGTVSGDCIGYFKAYIWADDNGNVKYSSKEDKSANGMYELATIKGDILSIPEIPGVAVRYNGHVGIYIGSGEVIEARGVDFGVVKTKLKDRGWTHWYEFPFIDYSGEDDMLQKGVKGQAVYAYQMICKKLGEDIGTFTDMVDGSKSGCDGDFGGTMVAVTNNLVKQYGLPTTELGVVSDALFGKLNKALQDLSSGGVPQAEYDALDAKYNKSAVAANALLVEIQTRDTELGKLRTEVKKLADDKLELAETLDVTKIAKQEAERQIIQFETENSRLQTLLNQEKEKLRVCTEELQECNENAAEGIQIKNAIHLINSL